MKYVVVIAGLIRDVVELYGVLREVQNLRRQGLVKRVILSSWLPEAKGNQDLFSKLRANGVEILLTEPIWGPIGSDANKQFSYQAVSLMRALDEVEPGEFVLRARTDKFAHFIPKFSGIMKTGLTRLDQESPYYVGHRWKIAVALIRAAVPFHIFDGVFLGERNDLYYTLNSSLSLDARIPKDGLGIENRWCVGPFLIHNRLFRSFFETFRSYDLQDYLNKWVGDGIDMPVSVGKIIGAYYKQAIFSFELVAERDWERSDFTLKSLFDPSDSRIAVTNKASIGKTRLIKSIEILASVVDSYEEGKAKDSGFESALRYLNTTKAPELTRSDLVELKGLFEPDSGSLCKLAREHYPCESGGFDLEDTFSVREALSLQCSRFGISTSDAEVIINALPREIGSADAYVAIAMLYFEGKAVARSDHHAELWLRAGAKLRNRSAQLKLGQLLLNRSLKMTPRSEVIAALDDLKRYDSRAEEILSKLQ